MYNNYVQCIIILVMMERVTRICDLQRVRKSGSLIKTFMAKITPELRTESFVGFAV